MRRKAIQRLRGQRGESIAETLIALLVAALALVMLAGAIGSAGDLITLSEKTMKNYYGGLSALGQGGSNTIQVALTDESGTAVKLVEGQETLTVQYAINNGFPNRPVLAYAMGTATGENNDEAEG